MTSKKEPAWTGGLFDAPSAPPPQPPATPAPLPAHTRARPAAVPVDPVRSVSQVNALITQALIEEFPAPLRVAGEISNASVSQRGHAYFTLKDPQAQLPCVIWRDNLTRLGLKIRDGLAVIVRGTVKFYEPHGRVQLYVDDISPQGTGALELAFRQLCEKLRLEGLFDPSRRRPLPRVPRRVVVVTSPTGDVLHDVLTTAHRRFPGLHIMVYPVAVQGPSAAGQIAAAIAQINRHSASLGGVDLIMLVRGGGSLEDLWAFNEEIVARAIVAGKIPVATGIGHEPDTTIADLVADLRGPTPTGVTELTVPDVRELLRELRGQAQMLGRDSTACFTRHQSNLRLLTGDLTAQTRRLWQMRSSHLEHAARRISAIEPRHAIAQNWRRLENLQRRMEATAQAARHQAVQSLATVRQSLAGLGPQALLSSHGLELHHLEQSLTAGMPNRIGELRSSLESLRQRLMGISPQAVLERGFSITTDAQGAIVRRTAQVQPGETIRTRVADGQISSTVD